MREKRLLLVICNSFCLSVKSIEDGNSLKRINDKQTETTQDGRAQKIGQTYQFSPLFILTFGKFRNSGDFAKGEVGLWGLPRA